jgi:amino acid transporter
MNDNAENLTPERRERIRRRRRALLWVLGITVLLLLAIIVSQQLWLWTVVKPDTAADALVLYALSTLNFVAFFVFLFIFVRNLLKLRRERQERQLGSKVKTRLLVYFISISFLPITAMAVFSCCKSCAPAPPARRAPLRSAASTSLPIACWPVGDASMPSAVKKPSARTWPPPHLLSKPASPSWNASSASSRSKTWS